MRSRAFVICSTVVNHGELEKLTRHAQHCTQATIHKTISMTPNETTHWKGQGRGWLVGGWSFEGFRP